MNKVNSKLNIKKETVQLIGQKDMYILGGNNEQASTSIQTIVSKIIRDIPTTGNPDDICGPDDSID